MVLVEMMTMIVVVVVAVVMIKADRRAAAGGPLRLLLVARVFVASMPCRVAVSWPWTSFVDTRLGTLLC